MSREKGDSLSRLLLILGAYKENNLPRFPQQEAGAGFVYAVQKVYLTRAWRAEHITGRNTA